MSDSRPLLDLMYALATSTSARRRFEADPTAMLDAHGLPADAAQAVLARDKRRVDLALLAEEREATQ